jgi:hypothetical protein
MAKFSEQEIDQILASVEEAMAQAESLAKSMPLTKEDEQDPQQDLAPQQPEQSQDMSMDQQPADAPAPEQADPSQPEQSQEQPMDEQQDQSQDEISDEELHSLYASMDPQELQRHQMAIEAAMGQGQQQEQPSQPQDLAMAEDDKDDKDDEDQEDDEDEEMSKSEKDEFSRLKKDHNDLQKSFAKVVEAMEKAFAPTRKAVTGIEYVQKSEETQQQKPLSKAETIAVLNEKAKDPTLSKSDRMAINDFILNGGSQDKIKTIIKGGK